MAGSGGFDWDLDLTPMRPPAPSPDAPKSAGAGRDGASLDVAAALSDLKRSVDRLAVRIGRLERGLAAEPATDQDPAEPVATRRLRTLRPESAPPPPRQLPGDGRGRRRAGGD